MSDYCPHCDDFSIDASRATRMDELERQEKSKDEVAKPKKTRRLPRKKIVINVDSSDENADWIKSVRDRAKREKADNGRKDTL